MGERPRFDEHSRPSPTPDARLTTSDAGNILELGFGGAGVQINDAGAIIWQSLDGHTDLDSIAVDLADVRGTTKAAELQSLIAFVERLTDHGLLSVEVGRDQTTAPTLDEETPPLDQQQEVVPHGFDFIMDSYPMSADPTGRPTSLDMFLATVPADSQHRSTFAELADSLIGTLGPDRTVWGLKLDDTGVSWELYFYPHRREDADSPASFFEGARSTFESLVGWDAPRSIPKNANLISFEFRIDEAGVSIPRELDIYHDVAGRSGMIVAYQLNRDIYRLKNTYEVFRLPDEADLLRARLDSSRYAYPENAGVAGDHWISAIESLRSCDLVWCSYKPDRDGVYAGRVDVSDLDEFLARYGYPQHLQDWVRGHLDQLDHLRYDIGMDYTIHDGQIQVHKTGFYGYF